MLRQLWHRLKSGCGRNVFQFEGRNVISNSCKIAPALLLFILTSLSPLNALAVEPTPLQRLQVRFDLAAGQLVGDAAIEIPAAVGASIGLSGISVGFMTINGEPLQMGEQEVLEIAAREESQLIRLAYSVNPSGPGKTIGYVSSAGVALARNWHPVVYGGSRFEFTATLPEGFTPLASVPASLAAEGVLFRIESSVEQIVFAAAPYVEQVFSVASGIDGRFFFLPQSSREERDRLVQAAGRSFEQTATLLGEYPAETIVIAQTLLPESVSENGLMLVGKEPEEEVLKALAQGIAGSWFGPSAWTNGLGLYLAGHLQHDDPAGRAAFRKGLLLFIQDSTVSARAEGSASEAGVAKSAAMTDAETLRGAARNAMVFHMLMRRIGEQPFFASLKDLIVQSRDRYLGWHDLRAIFEARSGEDLAPFFEAWSDYGVLPALSVKSARIEEKEGKPQLAFSLVQDGVKSVPLAVPLKIEAPGEEVLETVVLDGVSKDLTYSFAMPPTVLAVDPGYDLLRRLDPIELPPSWQRFINSSRKLIVSSGEVAEQFKPLVSLFAASGVDVVDAARVSDAELASGSVLLLGADTAKTQSLFAGTVHPNEGVTVDVRHHPFNPRQVVAIVSSDSSWQARTSLETLAAHRDADYLHVKSGVLREKNQPEAADGLRYLLDMPPGGVAVHAKLSFDEIVKRLADNRVVYVGEVHTRNEDHRLQLRIIRALHRLKPDLAVGMEMFPRDVQDVLDEYVAGKLDEREFLKKVAYFKNWGYDYRLYREIIDFARHNRIPVIGLNIKKDIVSKVFKEGGVSSLSEDERALIAAERNLDMPGYRQRLAQVFSMHDQHVRSPEQVNDFFQAQSIWDESMAESVAEYLQTYPDSIMVVVAGMGHTIKESGIPPRVARRITVPQAVVLNSQEREVGLDSADFLVFSPAEPLPPSPLLGVMIEDDKEGLLVKGVSPHGSAMQAGVKENDVIVALEGQPITEVDDLKIALLYKNKGDTVQVEIKRARTFFPDSLLNIDIKL